MIYDDSVPGCTQKYACFVHLKPFHQYQATGTGKGIFSCDNVLFSDTFSWSYYVYIHSSCIPMQQQQVFGSLYIIFSHFKLTVCTRLLEIEIVPLSRSSKHTARGKYGAIDSTIHNTQYTI